MFEKAKKDQRGKLIEALKYIVEQTQGPNSRVAVPKEYFDRIVKYEPTFVAAQGDPDPTGNVTVYATSAGIAASTGQQSAPAVEVVKPVFNIDTGIKLPESKRGGGAKTTIYPFASMEVEQSFFIAATPERPNPAKSLASTITSANRKYAALFPAMKGKKPHPQAGQPSGQDGRKFTVRPRTMEEHKEAGARVWRVA